jgi:hypothetical protein
MINEILIAGSFFIGSIFVQIAGTTFSDWRDNKRNIERIKIGHQNKINYMKSQFLFQEKVNYYKKWLKIMEEFKESIESSKKFDTSSKGIEKVSKMLNEIRHDSEMYVLREIQVKINSFFEIISEALDKLDKGRKEIDKGKRGLTGKKFDKHKKLNKKIYGEILKKYHPIKEEVISLIRKDLKTL